MSYRSGQALRRPCVVITYPFAIGHAYGASRHCREVARHLAKLGSDVIIISVLCHPLSHRYPRQGLPEEFFGLEYDDEFSQDSVEVIRVSQHPLHLRLDGLQVKKALKTILKRRRVDIVLSFGQEAAFLPALLRSRNVSFGCVATMPYAFLLKQPENEARVHKFVRTWLDNHFIIENYNRADIIFANSHSARNELVELMGVDDKRITVCPLGVEPSFLEIPRTESKEVTQFIFFGRIDRRKGILDTIGALSKLAAKGFNHWTYRIFGEGARHWVQKLACEYGIDDKVIISGPVDDATLRRELQRAHLAILPSHAESFGLSIAEAQAAGLPVIAYEVSSVPEVVENGVTAWLAPFREIDQLAQCIETAIRDPEKTYQAGLAGRERVKRVFTWQKTAATMYEKIQSVRSNG